MCCRTVRDVQRDRLLPASMTGSNINHGWRNPELGSDGRFYRGVGSPGGRRFANSHDQLRGIPVRTTDAGT